MSPASPSLSPPRSRKRLLISASWAGTAVFVLTAAAAAVTANAVLEAISTWVDLALFLSGCLAFAAAYALAVPRSRREEISVNGLYLLMGGSTPPEVRRQLLGALAVQVVTALLTALARLYSPLAFGILVPVYGLGLAGLWAARHGRFPQRRMGSDQPGRRAQRTR